MELLSEDNLLADPIRLFAQWYEDAKSCEAIKLPDAMCLSTICSDGYPEGRMVLLKGFDEHGFVLFTNTLSPKGHALAFAPRAELTFYWMPLDRQVRVQGDVQPLKNDEADAYFATRPRGGQLSAWASKQSETVKDRAELEERMREFEEKYRDKDVPRPPHWGGYRVQPQRVEFWQNRDDRLHDRFRFLKSSDGVWKVERLYP